MISAKEHRIDRLRCFLDSRDFYELAQVYRHAEAQKPADVVAAYEEMKKAILAALRAIK